MSTSLTQAVKHRRPLGPKLLIDAVELPHLEALADGAVQRSPDLADRLLDELARATIVASWRMPANVVSIGSIVTYRDETSGQETTVTLVYPEDADIAHRRVSVMTPIGVALLGLTEKAEFYWDTRGGQRKTLTVLRVEPAAGEEA